MTRVQIPLYVHRR